MEQFFNLNIISVITLIIALVTVIISYRNLSINESNLKRQFQKNIQTAWINEYRKEVANFISIVQVSRGGSNENNLIKLHNSIALLKLYLDEDNSTEKYAIKLITDVVSPTTTKKYRTFDEEIEDIIRLSKSIIAHKEYELLEKIILWKYSPYNYKSSFGKWLRKVFKSAK